MIELKNISKTYVGKAGSPPVKALDDVSLTFAETGMVFILGKSGSGKSTLLNIIGGLDRYDRGDLIIKGKSTTAFTQSDFDSYRNTMIGFIFQEYNVLDEFTVGANIALAMELQGKKVTGKALNEILEQVDLGKLAARKPNTLSGGQKQRVAIARALIKNPEIIMADEPTGALDSATGKQVFETLKKLSKEKLVIVVSHDRDFAEQYGDRIIEFADGKVVSDVTKYSVDPQPAGDGIGIVDGKILHVKKGYKLTKKDLAMINEYLANAESDIIIGTDEAANAAFKKAARIDDEGKKESFADTDTEAIGKDYTPQDCKLIKSHLPFKNSFLIGASGLKYKPVRLIVTILLCCVAFTMFGLSDSMAGYNKIKNARYSLIDTGITVAMFQKGYRTENGLFDFTNEVLMSNEDLSALQERTGQTFKPLYNGSYGVGGTVDFRSHILDGTELLGENSAVYYFASLVGFSPLTEAEVSAMGGRLIAGKFPSRVGEVALSKYVYEHFALGGFVYYDGDEKITVPAEQMTEQSLIGKTLTFGMQVGTVQLTVSGIVDTKVPSRYDDLKPSDKPGDGIDLSDLFNTIMLSADLEGGLHRIGIVSPEGFTAVVDPSGIVGVTVGGADNAYVEGPSAYVWPQRLATRAQVTAAGLHILEFDPQVTAADDIFPSGSIAQQLAADDWSYDGDNVVIPLDADDVDFAYVEGSRVVTAGTEMAPSEMMRPSVWLSRAAYRTACASVPDGIKTLFETRFGGDAEDPESLAVFYTQYLMAETLYDINDKLVAGGILENAYGEACGYDLMVEELQSMFSKYYGQLFPDMFDFCYSKYSDEQETQKAVNVAGILLPDKESFGESLANGIDYALYNAPCVANLMVSPEDAVTMFIGSGTFAAAIAPMPLDDTKAMDRIIKVHYADKDNTIYTLGNSVSAVLDMSETVLGVLSKVFLVIGIGFAVFAAALLCNFIAVSISYKRREIGILRAVGAKSSDVFGIFFNESMLIALINFVLSLISVSVIVGLTNLVLRVGFGMIITVLHFGIRQIALMLGISVLVAFVASFIPVYRIAKKRPIDAIRG